MTLLVTGFEAFGGIAVNPADILVRRLGASPPAGVSTLLLPVEYERAAARLLAEVDRIEPAAVLMFGLAGNTQYLRLERFGRNRCTSAAADNAGVRRVGLDAVEGAPETLETGFDLAALRDDLAPIVPGIVLSDDAGGYVCNDLYFRVLLGLAPRRPAVPALFVHLPWVHRPLTLDDYEETPAAAHERIGRAVVTAVEARLAAAHAAADGVSA